MTTYINYMHNVTPHPHPTPKFIIKKIVYLKKKFFFETNNMSNPGPKK
jgi:hypothetical protein